MSLATCPHQRPPVWALLLLLLLLLPWCQPSTCPTPVQLLLAAAATTAALLLLLLGALVAQVMRKAAVGIHH
jgi:hypothetical protein